MIYFANCVAILSSELEHVRRNCERKYSYSRRKCILLLLLPLLLLLLLLLRQTGDQLNGGAIFFLRRATTVINDPALVRRNLRSIIRLLFFDFLFFAMFATLVLGKVDPWCFYELQS